MTFSQDKRPAPSVRISPETPAKVPDQVDFELATGDCGVYAACAAQGRVQGRALGKTVLGEPGV
jgi:hypothetical protein